MANQFVRRGPPDRIKTGHDESTKDKIRAEMLSKRLEKYAKAKGKQVDKYRMEPAQVQACKVLIDRGKPMLQAVQQTTVDPITAMSLEEQIEVVKTLIRTTPELLRIFAPGPRLDNTDTEHDTAQHEGAVLNKSAA